MSSSFRGCGGSYWGCLAPTVESLSESLWPTELGLAVGLISLWCYRYLLRRLETFEHEMECVSLELLNQLARHRGQWDLGPTMQPVDRRPTFGELPIAELRKDQTFWNRAMILTCTVLLLTWCTQAMRYFWFDTLPLISATWVACKYVLVTFAISCLPAHVVWIKVLHRRRGGLAVVASAFCLCWFVAELLLGIHIH